MTSILYLGVEGVLFPRRSQRIPHYQLENPGAAYEFGLSRNIAQIVMTRPELAIVLNSWWVADFGYRRLVQMLPDEIASRTIGATTPGNRMHRREPGQQTRLDFLRADIHRRCPESLTIVDASRTAIPFEYASRTVLVDYLRPDLFGNFCNDILRLLSSVTTLQTVTNVST
ncbi:HAD domain-containing protein [Paraburkholderia caffeinilytica]|uniref:HAD domain-containing protein n=1 Tax=Paraburkholderia caffeinilytica TaxID=1761016 RepID=UPI0038B95594